MKYRGPKNRIARRFGINLFGRLRNPLLHKTNPPGMHGSKHKKKSDYGTELEEKQKLKAIYGMLSQKQLINIYKKALQLPGNTAHLFLSMLECRLDNIVYRLKLAPTIFGAQQLVSHGHILVDGKKVDRRSFLVKPGMIISIKPASQQMKIIKFAQDTSAREIPEYLELNEDKFGGKLVSIPLLEQVPLPVYINVPLICDFLAHTT